MASRLREFSIDRGAMSVVNTAKRDVTIEIDHMIACLCGDESGPSLVVVGSIHGNEPSGAQALRNVAPSLQTMEARLRGRVFFVEGNVRASGTKVRFIDTDLNRAWKRANLAKTGLVRTLTRAEDLELYELQRVFREILNTARNEVFVLDLHTTSAAGLPFATVGDTLRNRHFAKMFPVTMMLGIEEQLEGTILEYLNNKGAVTMFHGFHYFCRTTVLIQIGTYLPLLSAAETAKQRKNKTPRTPFMQQCIIQYTAM